MAKSTFDSALALVLDLEGGFADHPRDPGGATNRGITRATLAGWRGRPVSKTDVKELSAREAGAIYRGRYWDAVAGDDLPPGLDLTVFDYAVHSGPVRALRSLQTVLGLPEDGRIGPKTIAAAAACEPRETIRTLTRERLRILRGLPTWSVFGRGWTSRTTRVEAQALAAAASRHGPLQDRPAPARVAFIDQPEESTMLETKNVLASRTVWANLVGLGCIGLGLLGVQTGAVDQSGLAEALAQIAAGISFVASTFFRVQATKQLAAPGS